MTYNHYSIDLELQELVKEIQQLPPNSRRRRKLFNELIKKINEYEIVGRKNKEIRVPGILLSLEKLIDKERSSLARKAKKYDEKSTTTRSLVSQKWAQEELYAEAKANTFLYICDNIHEYDPKKGTVRTWVNKTLCWKFLDAFNSKYRG